MPTWGHLTPLLLLSSRLVQQHPNVHITIATAGLYHERFEANLLRYFNEENLHLMKNVRVLSLAGSGDRFFELYGPWMEKIPEFYSNLYEGKETICYGSGRAYPPLPRPKHAIVDMFGDAICQIIRGISKHEVPVYAWQSGGCTPVYWFAAPEDRGGIGDIAAKSQALAKTTGKTPREIEFEFWHPTTTKVVELPGIGKLYNYECSLQFGAEDMDAATPMDAIHSTLNIMLRECDGLILHNNYALEPEATEAWRRWFKDTNRPCFSVGPLIASNNDPKEFIEGELEASPFRDKIVTFLDRIKEQYGKRSLLYIAFGTFWWPSSNAIWEFIDVAINMNIPMFVTHNEVQGKIPEHILEKLTSNDNILVVPWAPQLYLLNNDTVGWFLSHCGNNSSIEAMYAGVPIIGCPLDGDQPLNAMYINTVHGVGFELIEPREWIGTRPFYRGMRRTGTEQGARDEARRILYQAFGPEGERRRRNAMEFRKQMQACWAEDGVVRKDFIRLSEMFSK